MIGFNLDILFAKIAVVIWFLFICHGICIYAKHKIDLGIKKPHSLAPEGVLLDLFGGFIIGSIGVLLISDYCFNKLEDFDKKYQVRRLWGDFYYFN